MANFFMDDTVFLKCQKSSLTQIFLASFYDLEKWYVSPFLVGSVPIVFNRDIRV
jgi:hypothetical protein